MHRSVVGSAPVPGDRTARPGADPRLDELIESAADVPALKSLLRISAAVLRSTSFDEFLEAVAEQACVAVSAASVSVSRWEREAGALRTLVNVGDLAPHEQRWPVDEFYDVAGDPELTDLLLQGCSYLNSRHDPGCPPASRQLLEQLGKDCELAVPVMVGDAMWGEIWATGTGRRFDHGDAQLLQAIAAYLAVAIGRTELLSTVWGYAYEDPLTGLANRRAIDSRFSDIDWQRCCPVALVGDLDGFKQVNDREGHPAGDQLLRAVAEALTAAMTGTDDAVVARLGGDEFCVLLTDGTLAEAQILAGRATERIDAVSGGAVTVSWGAAAAGPEISTGEALLAAGDAALLEAKRHGSSHFSSMVLTEDLPPPGGRAGDGRHGTDVLVDAVVRILDDHPALSEIEALEVLAVQMQRVVHTCAYAISVVTEDGLAVVTPRKVDIVAQPGSGLAILTDLGVDGGVLADFPASERAVRTGTTFLAARGCADSDPAEIALLEHLGYGAVLGVGVRSARHRYLVEFYSNTGHEELRVIAPLIQVLSRYCVSLR